MSQFFTYAILVATVASDFGSPAPFLLAALGETMGQRSGVINLGWTGSCSWRVQRLLHRAETNNLLFAVLVGVGSGR